MKLYSNRDDNKYGTSYQIFEAASASHRAEDAFYGIDGDMATYWTSGIHQEAGMWYQIELKEKAECSGIELEYNKSPWDYPRTLKIYVSAEGEEFQELEYIQCDDKMMFDTVSVKYIRFELGETQESVPSNWTVEGVTLYCSYE